MTSWVGTTLLSAVRKWYKKVLWRLVNMALVNAWIVFKAHTHKSVTHAVFHREVLVQLAEIGKPHPVRRNHPPDQVLLRLTPGNHFPEPHPATACKPSPCKTCTVCSALHKRKESRYRCATCTVSLCVYPCFGLYHTHRDFKQASQRFHRPVVEEE